MSHCFLQQAAEAGCDMVIAFPKNPYVRRAPLLQAHEVETQGGRNIRAESNLRIGKAS